MKVVTNLRKTGIAFMNDIPWGTHICGFYETIDDYLDLAIPYLRAGLTHGEYCMWVVPDILTPQQALEAIQNKVEDFHKLCAGMEILTHDEWYFRYGDFQSQQVLNGWNNKVEYSLSHGYDGLRLIGSPEWLDKDYWKSLIEYEAMGEEAIDYLNMIALCPYQLSRCTISNIIDLVSTHQFALIKSKHDWKYADNVVRFDRINTISKMAAGIVHEIRNPMTSVQALMQLLQTKDDFKAYHDLFDRIIDELDRVNGIMTDYLSSASEKEKKVKRQNLNDILVSILPLIRAEAEKQKMTVSFQPGDISDIVVDNREIRQVVLNLARNGLEAMREGGKLEFRTYMQPRGAVLEVKDHGSGIPASIMEKLGKPFHTTKENGTGLGLHVTLKILEKYHAQTRVTSSSSGTTFTICFPIAESNVEYA